MDKTNILKALQELRKNSPKRAFTQSVDCIINLRDLDLKKPEGQIDYYFQLPKPTGKKVTVCALIGAELLEQAKKSCDAYIADEEFKKYDKKAIKKLATTHTYFIAQASLMTEIAKNFGRILGPRGKMPNPKAGAVIPPTVNLQQVADRLRATTKVANKQQASLKITVGKETMSDDDLAENILAFYKATVPKLAREVYNIRELLIKFTMSKPVKVP